MDTLEARIERLERSCRRWRVGCLVLLAAGLCGAAAVKPDGDFAHLTAESLTIRSQPGGAFMRASVEDGEASVKLSAPGAATLVALEAKKDGANVFVSRSTPKGLSSAGMSADEQSGFVSLRTCDGKNKEVEPE